VSNQSTKIDKRDDVNAEEGERKYGDVKFDAGEVETIKNRIKQAAKKHGVEIGED